MIGFHLIDLMDSLLLSQAEGSHRMLSEIPNFQIPFCPLYLKGKSVLKLLGSSTPLVLPSYKRKLHPPLFGKGEPEGIRLMAGV
jgi:hypothetical protein